jgi:hypothetical protein
MTSAKQQERLAQAALTVPAVTGQWHYPAPGTATSGCFVAQAKAPQHSKQTDLTTRRREAEGARACTRTMPRADKDMVWRPKVTRADDESA